MDLGRRLSKQPRPRNSHPAEFSVARKPSSRSCLGSTELPGQAIQIHHIERPLPHALRFAQRFT